MKVEGMVELGKTGKKERAQHPQEPVNCECSQKRTEMFH